MDSTESRYNFYARAFRGGAQTATIESAQQEQPQQDQQVQQVQQQQESQAQTNQPQVSNGDLEEEKLNQLNQQVPKTKVDFKITSIIGNLDQTLGTKQKINIDKLFVEQLFGSTY